MPYTQADDVRTAALGVWPRFLKSCYSSNGRPLNVRGRGKYSTGLSMSYTSTGVFMCRLSCVTQRLCSTHGIISNVMVNSTRNPRVGETV